MSTYYLNDFDREILSQNEKKISVQLDLLESTNKLIQSMDASLISISLSVDADSDIRRTGTLNIFPDFDGYEVTAESKTWIDRMLRVYLKYYSNILKKEVSYCMGTFLVDTKTFTLDEANDSLSITLVDLMAKLDGTYGGELGEEEVVIPMLEPEYDEYGNPVWATDKDGNIEYETDDDGNIVYETDDDGNPIIDPSTGQPIPKKKQATVPTKIRDAMIKTIALAGIDDYIIDDIHAYDYNNSTVRYFDYSNMLTDIDWDNYEPYQFIGVYGGKYEVPSRNFPYEKYQIMDDGVPYYEKILSRMNTTDGNGNYTTSVQLYAMKNIERPYAFYYKNDEIVLERKWNITGRDILYAFDREFSNDGLIAISVADLDKTPYNFLFSNDLDKIITHHNVLHYDVCQYWANDDHTQLNYVIILYHDGGNRLYNPLTYTVTNSNYGAMTTMMFGITAYGQYRGQCRAISRCQENVSSLVLQRIYLEPRSLYVVHQHENGDGSHYDAPTDDLRVYPTSFIYDTWITTNDEVQHNKQYVNIPSDYTNDYTASQRNNMANYTIYSGRVPQLFGYQPYSEFNTNLPLFDTKAHADAFLMDGSTDGLLNPCEKYNKVEFRYTVDQPFELVYYTGETIDNETRYYVYAVSTDMKDEATTSVKKKFETHNVDDDVVVDYGETLIQKTAYQKGHYYNIDDIEPFAVIDNLNNKQNMLTNLKRFISGTEKYPGNTAIMNYILYGDEDGLADDPCGKMDNTIPYDITIDGGTCVADVVKELRDLYPGYETYFDTLGVFHCHMIPTCANDDYTLTKDDFKEDIAIYSEQRNYAYSSVKNAVQVYGEEYEDIDWFADPDNSKFPKGSTTLEVDFVKDKFKGYDNDMLLAIKLTKPNPGKFHINIKGMTPVDTENPTTPSNNEEEDPGYFYGSTPVMQDAERGIWLEAGKLIKDVVYILRYTNGNFEYVSSFQPKGMAISVSEEPTEEIKQQWKDKYNCDNIVFVPDPNNPFTTDRISLHYTKNVETKDMQIIRTDKEALAFAEYELWRYCRLPNNITITCDVLPFLDVNQKIEYKHLRSGETHDYITKNISIDISETSAQSTITASLFNSLYPEIIGGGV